MRTFQSVPVNTEFTQTVSFPIREPYRHNGTTLHMCSWHTSTRTFRKINDITAELIYCGHPDDPIILVNGQRGFAPQVIVN